MVDTEKRRIEIKVSIPNWRYLFSNTKIFIDRKRKNMVKAIKLTKLK